MDFSFVNGSIMLGILGLLVREQIQSFFRGAIVSIKNSTKKGHYYLMRNRNTDKVFLVKVLNEKLFFHPGCHIQHYFSNNTENIAWGVYQNYTFMPIKDEYQKLLEQGNVNVKLEEEKLIIKEKKI